MHATSIPWLAAVACMASTAALSLTSKVGFMVNVERINDQDLPRLRCPDIIPQKHQSISRCKRDATNHGQLTQKPLRISSFPDPIKISVLRKRNTSGPVDGGTDDMPPQHAREQQPATPHPAAPNDGGPTTESIAAQVEALRADKNLYAREYLGRDKAPLRAELRALPPQHPRRQRYEYYRTRYAALRYWQATGTLPPPPKRDPAHPLAALRARLRRELAPLPPRELRALWNTYHREFSRGARARAERARVAALPLDDAARQRYERLHAAARLVNNAIAAEKRAVARLKSMRDQYAQRFLGEGGEGGAEAEAQRAALERGEGESKAVRRYAQLKQAYEEYEAKYSQSYVEGGRKRRRPRKALPPDIRAAMESLKPSVREYERLKLSHKAHIEAYLAGDDENGTRQAKYLQLKADAAEYRRLRYLLKKGYTGGERLPASLGNWGGDAGEDGDELEQPSDEAGAPGSLGSSSEGSTKRAGEANAIGDDTVQPPNIGDSSHFRMQHKGLSSPHDLWRAVSSPLSAAADRIRVVSTDVGRSVGPAVAGAVSQAFGRSTSVRAPIQFKMGVPR